MSHSPSPRLLIAGAGPVGLTMAAHLRAHGLTPRVVDKAPHPSTQSKALVLWPRSLEMLDDLGIVDRFLADGRSPTAIRFHGNGRVLAEIIAGAGVEGTAFPRPLILAQSETERLLAEHLAEAGIPVERPVELVRFAEAGDGVDATLRHADGREEEVRCDYLLGCDGAHSAVRHGLGIEFSGKAEPLDFILADCRVEGIPQDSVDFFMHPDGLLGLFPFGDGRCRIIADLGKAPGDGKPADPTLEQVQAIVDARGPGGVTLSDPVWLSGFRINERKVADYRHGRCFLAGDAAHIHSPAGGQGMNTGMQDTWNLTWKLALVATGRAKASLLDSYNPERGAVGEMVLRNATRMTRFVTLRNPVAQFLRSRFVGLVGQISAARRALFNSLTELGIHYAESPLNGESTSVPWATGGLKPGDRMPDGTLRSPSGEERRLLAILRGPDHHLLLLPSDASKSSDLAEIGRQAEAMYPGVVRAHVIAPGASAPGADWIDPEGSLRRILGAREPSPALALVRPDGYLGYRGQPASWDDLRAYLDRYLIPSA